MYTHVNLLGPYNSGTNLVHNLLKPVLKSRDEGTTHIWKHSRRKLMIEEYTQKHPNTLFVICYRPLYSWLKSCEKTPYGIVWDGKLNTKITIDGFSYNNIIDVYEHYYNLYQYLLERCPNTVVVEYYKVCDAAISYDYMQEKMKPFGVVLPDRTAYNAILNTAAKPHGSTVANASEALEKGRRLAAEAPKDLKINPQIVAYYEKHS